jgi:TPP-dependent pyruvate/acetoin dehydrogenase alpha subunit
MLGQRLRKPSLAEALVAGTLQNLDATDTLVCAGADPVLEVLRGGELSNVVGPKLSKSKLNNGQPESRIVEAAPEIAAAIAAGIATAMKRSAQPSLVLCIVPEKVTRGWAWQHATEFASAQRAPIVFVSDGTGYRGSRPHDGKSLSRWPFPSITVDARDVIAVYRVTKEAMAAARRGHGPTLVDGIDFLAPGKRGKDERDPIAHFRGYLKRHDAWSDDWNSELENRLTAEIGLKPKPK